MRLDIAQNPIAVWLYAERYLSIGVRSYSPFSAINEVPPVYQPESAAPVFSVPTFWIDNVSDAEFTCSSDRISSELAAIYSPDRRMVLLPIHPAAIPLLSLATQNGLKKLPVGPSLEVSPTSSTRTVYVHRVDGFTTVPQHFLKLHFPGRISRFVRSLTWEEVRQQLWISREIQRARLHHLPDLGGGHALSRGGSSVSFLLRSAQPVCDLGDRFFTVPGFSLYGGDRLVPEDPPLLVQLPQLFGESAADFIVGRIIVPTVELWVRIVSRTGTIPELHGQNVLFCFDLSGLGSSVCFRDFDLFIDRTICQAIGVDCPDLPIASREESKRVDTDQLLSLSYDGFLVHHFLARIAGLAEDRFGIPRHVIRGAARAAFKAAGGNNLPVAEKCFYYQNRLYPGKQFTLREDASFELWR